jgi:hypothetical protein
MMVLCPEGTAEFSPGFQPWEPSKKRFAMKGREMRLPDETRTYWQAKVNAELGRATIGHRTLLLPY